MYLQQLKNLMVSRDLNQTAIAAMAGVTRASVSKWFKDATTDWVNVETRTVIQLAHSLKLSPAHFLTPNENLEKYQTRYLWDSLYPNMELFLKAVRKKKPVALARLVQVAGFRSAISIIGKSIVKNFKGYAKFIHPVRRRELELLWPLYKK